MKTISGRAFPVCMIVIACAVGCGSPKTQFEAFIAKADTAFRADKALQADHVFDPVQYDIRKTESEVSPHIAEVLVAGVYLPAYARKALRLLGNEAVASAAIQSELHIDEATAKQALKDSKDPKKVQHKGFSHDQTPEGRALDKALEEASDDGFRKYLFKYAHQDGKWVLTGSELQAKNTEVMLKGVPKAMSEYFAP